jgi:hypothetical protein
MGEGRSVPPHASGPGLECVPKPRAPFAYPGRDPHATDPDETAGRRLYRARAEAEARRQIAYERHRVRLKQECVPMTQGEEKGR